LAIVDPSPVLFICLPGLGTAAAAMAPNIHRTAPCRALICAPRAPPATARVAAQAAG
jgi:hypothetical protein